MGSVGISFTYKDPSVSLVEPLNDFLWRQPLYALKYIIIIGARTCLTQKNMLSHFHSTILQWYMISYIYIYDFICMSIYISYMSICFHILFHMYFHRFPHDSGYFRPILPPFFQDDRPPSAPSRPAGGRTGATPPARSRPFDRRWWRRCRWWWSAAAWLVKPLKWWKLDKSSKNAGSFWNFHDFFVKCPREKLEG